MYKYTLIATILFAFGLHTKAQNYGTEWINYSQSYYKFPVVKNGIYRITYAELMNAGVPLPSINDPRNMQIFGRGKEVPLYISNENSGVFSTNDYIEFYAKKNDAWFDTALYKQSSWIPNIDYSLFTDTAYYYFTWNNSVSNARMSISNDANFSSYTESNYFIYDSRTDFSTYYLEGEKQRVVNNDFIELPTYLNGEGWYDTPISLGGSRTRSVSTKNVYTPGPIAKTYIDIMGASNFYSRQTPTYPNHHEHIEFAGLTVDTLYRGYKRLHIIKNIPNSALGNSSTSFTYSSINDINSGADRFAIPFCRIVYAHTPALENKNEFDLWIPNAVGQSKAFYDFSNFAGGDNPVLYDLDNHRRIVPTKVGSNYKVLIPNASGQKHCFIAAENSIHVVGGMRPVSNNAHFTNYITLNPNADYIIITNHSLMGNGGALATATAYGAYRNTTGYNTMVVDIEDLYHQYSYGIRKDPMAIRNFVRALGSAYGYSQFKALFLIGKSYRATDYRKNATLFKETLVPTMGSPPSDMLIVSGLVDNLFQPAIPIGRLSAKTIDHVDLYLHKVEMMEDSLANPHSMWMKRILHFSGGSDEREQIRFSGYLANYKRIAEDTLMGANVTTFYKSSTDPIQINLSDEIKKYVNSGVSMLTFFGHAAGIGFDISIDDPHDYSNYGKYPFLLANSCYAGDIFQNTVGTANSSEEFVLIRDKGMIGYLASITQARDGLLNIYSNHFYKNLSSKYYGKTIGKIIQQTVKDIQVPINVGIEDICLEMTLHADPAIRLYPSSKPDYFINDKSAFYTPGIVSTEVDSFVFNLVVSNQGRAVNDSILIEINRKYPNKDSIDFYTFAIKAPHYRDTLKVTMPVNRAYGIGDNKISVRVDAHNFIQELSEDNNAYTYTLNIKAADLSPVFPPPYAIVPNSNVTLKASTYYPFTPVLNYVFEMDTSVYFNSPVKISHHISSAGGVLSWSPNTTLQDSMVYYWRVSLDSNSRHNYNWRNSSFQYIQGLHGWSQSHFFQFEKDKYQFTKFDAAHRTFKFVNDIKTLRAQTGKYPYIAWTEIYLKVNYEAYEWACIPYNKGGVRIFVFDKTTANLWVSPTNNGTPFGPFGNLHCPTRPYWSIDFATESLNMSAQGYGIVKDTTWFRRIANFLALVPDGDHVLIESFNNAHTANWPEYLYKEIDTIGSSYIRNIPNDRPFIIFGKKGALGAANEVIGTTDSSIIVQRDSVISNWKEGNITSTIIGPSKKWSSLHWRQHSMDSSPTDSVRLRLIGIKGDGSKHIIIDGIPPDSADINLLNDRMPAATYPYCQLECFMRDDSLRTPAYIDNWSIYYQPAPEAALDPITHFSFYSDTIMQGDTAVLQLAYRNISDVDMDSLLVIAYVIDNSNGYSLVKQERLKPLLKNSTIIDTIKFSTAPWLGSCRLFVEINPINSHTGIYDQIEDTHINNKADIPFFVEKDDENPLLDVTFDGVHILDGDIVSAQPVIVIGLKDNSKFKAINDTALFKVRIKKLGDENFHTINFSDPNNVLEFIPAQLPENSAQVIYRPKLQDGEYQLLIYANDASNNKSGTHGYRIDFVVINRASITQMMNWPNPFSDKTHFVFTLTGSNLPSYIKIQILTVTGKVVREIDMDELGPLHIGRNITEYAWDGKDQFGDQLANGVYLYRVITRLNGESIEHRNSGADKYFKNNFGKMYLMR